PTVHRRRTHPDWRRGQRQALCLRGQGACGRDHLIATHRVRSVVRRLARYGAMGARFASRREKARTRRRPGRRYARLELIHVADSRGKKPCPRPRPASPACHRRPALLLISVEQLDVLLLNPNLECTAIAVDDHEVEWHSVAFDLYVLDQHLSLESCCRG